MRVGNIVSWRLKILNSLCYKVLYRLAEDFRMHPRNLGKFVCLVTSLNIVMMFFFEIKPNGWGWGVRVVLFLIGSLFWFKKVNYADILRSFIIQQFMKRK